MRVIIGIYAIVNILNNHCYIGSSVDIRSRWNSHRSQLMNNNHHSRYLQNAWNKYGKDSFRFQLICIASERSLRFIEAFFLSILSCEYNCDEVDSSCNYRKSEQTKAYLSTSHTGKILDVQTKSKISEKLKGMKKPFGHASGERNSRAKLTWSMFMNYVIGMIMVKAFNHFQMNTVLVTERFTVV